jgi:hypothetical protein
LKRYTQYLFRLTFFTILASLCWGVSESLGVSAGKLEAGHFVAFPDTTRPDTTLRFPIPESQNPYDAAPAGGLYLREPSNVKQDVIYDPASRE